ncbi:hypothetical protein [Mucilaginibacter sp.]|jgi:hypothetical protein|uniref:hypothetical protein n=1 Tax=Mucilaginibacter sp. TaxID=1882438 RepID=UPI002C2F145B|nr:hypothetical protein [Mucilaginibacter sp.]HTI59071.1 hypothetical protein [Mucilaginibacter sp.]
MKTLTKTQADFLDYLEPVSGLPKEVPVRTFMMNNFDKPKDLSQFADNDKEPGKLLLLDLLDNELIKGNRNDVTHICDKDWTTPKNGVEYQQWFDTLQPTAKMKITKKGSNALEAYRENNPTINAIIKSNNSTGQAIKENSSIQKTYAFVSMVAIGITAIFAIATFYKDDPISLKEISKSMQRQEQLLDSLRKVQLEMSASLKIMATKTLPKKK